MSIKKNALATVALTGIAVAVSSAYAAGFQLTEQSSLGLGRAYAGAGVVGDDLSAAHYNPAGMTLLPGTQIQAGSVYIEVDAPFTGKDTTAFGQGQTVKDNGRFKGQAIPHGYITHQVNDQTWLGLAMTVPFGMGTENKKDWAFAEAGNESMVMTIDINPSIAYKVNDFISIAAGLSIQYAKAELGKRALHPIAGAMNRMGDLYGKVKADSWDWGYNLGIMIQPTETLRFGLSYRSAIEHNAEGDFTLSGTTLANFGGSLTMGDAEVYVKTPDTVYFTGTWEATQDLRLSGLVRWAKWSNFKRLDIYSDSTAALGGMMGLPMEAGKPVSESEHKWDDTWLFSLGADYRLNNEWTVRGGIAYETGAIDAQYRTATIPDADRVWFTLGATYNYSKQMQFDFGAAYLRGVGNKDLYHHNKYNPTGNYKVGEYDSIDAYILGAQVQYRF